MTGRFNTYMHGHKIAQTIPEPFIDDIEDFELMISPGSGIGTGSTYLPSPKSPDHLWPSGSGLILFWPLGVCDGITSGLDHCRAN